jgi:DNA replication protein DnaC
MLIDEISACCKQLKLGQNIARMSGELEAETHQEYLLKLLRSEIEHRETLRKDKLLKNAGFYSHKSFADFRFDEVTLPRCVHRCGGAAVPAWVEPRFRTLRSHRSGPESQLI